MSQPLSQEVLDQLFVTARTHNRFTGEVSDETLQRLYELVKMGPTAANSCPARFVFVKSPEAKQRLAPALDEGNRDKTIAAPVTVIVSLLGLAILGGVSAAMAGSPVVRGVVRVLFWGAAAMALTAVVGRMFGVAA